MPHPSKYTEAEKNQILEKIKQLKSQGVLAKDIITQVGIKKDQYYKWTKTTDPLPVVEIIKQNNRTLPREQNNRTLPKEDSRDEKIKLLTQYIRDQNQLIAKLLELLK